MSQDRYTELAADYALGLLEEEDLTLFERHLAEGCPACERELASMDAVADALAYSVPAALPPQDLRDRIFAEVEPAVSLPPVVPVAPITPPTPTVPERAPEARPRGEALPEPDRRPEGGRARQPGTADQPGLWARLAPGLAFAGVLATALTGAYALRLHQQLGVLRGELERVSSEMAAMERAMDVVSSPGLRLVRLEGKDPAPRSNGRVLWSPSTRKAILVAHDLPRPPANKDYQLWVIEGSTPRSEGVFRVDDKGTSTYALPEVPDASTVSAFAVTIEPAGGVPQPTGPMVLVGAVSAKVD